jgi:ribosomal subunit interface protein
MEVVIRGHQTDVTTTLKTRAEEGVTKLNEHFKQLISADVLFGWDGVFKSVEIVVQAPNNTRLVARSDGKYHEAALTDAIGKMAAQIRKLKTAKKKQVHGLELRA